MLIFTRGGFVVWRTAQFYPDLVTHVFSVCTPYSAPQEHFISTEDLVKGPLPQFAYQLHLASGEVEKSVKDEQSIRQFLKGMYGGKGPDGEVMFVPEKGVIPENLEKVGDNQLLNGEVSDDLLSFCGQKRDIKKKPEDLLCEKKITHARTRVFRRETGRLLSENVAICGVLV
jgi:hypothetical protein